ncbi:ornithine decarboxylase 2 isoform X1 [Leptinotarsa decemlineata]|uniref:ornithine decarboxylase 2 isoform X1 n=1 Tax=Leptinotarsa decemlineata TaxID=7539 RepID=UPI003D306662
MECANRIQVLDKNDDVYSVIKKITEEGGLDESFYVCDVSELVWKCNNWKKLIPRIEPYYAVKCNDSRIVLQTMAALGTGFDCASREEIRRVLSLGVKPNKIVFANPTKKISHIIYAAEMGISAMTFDNEFELYKIKKHYPGAELILRIKCDDVTAKYVLGQKYGADPEQESERLLSLAKSLDLNVIGIAFHIGSGCSNYAIYLEALAAARHVFDIGKSLGYVFRFLDIGGGFPAKKSNSIDEIAKYVNKGLAEYFSDTNLQIISEPGNYFVNSAFKLVSNIHSKRIITEARKNGAKETSLRMYYIDVSLYTALIPVLFQEFYECRPVKSIPNAPEYPSIIWGPTCDCSDKISNGAVPMRDMEIGEWMIFEEAGGYTLSIASEFNGFPVPDIHAVVNEEDWLFLTEKAPKPLSREKFVSSKNLESYLTGLGTPCTFRTNYF